MMSRRLLILVSVYFTYQVLAQSECLTGADCEESEYCLCGENLFGVVDCETFGSFCDLLPRGATQRADSYGFEGCDEGNDCGDGYYCNCYFDQATEQYDCSNDIYSPICELLADTGLFNPRADAGGPGFYECLAGDDCPDGDWCDCFLDDNGNWDCDTAGGSQCTSLSDEMTAVSDGPGYYRCTNGLMCDEGQFCNCQGSFNENQCYEREDGNSICENLDLGYVAYTEHPHDYACNNGTYSDAVPGMSGGHSGCLSCAAGRFSEDDGTGKSSCSLSKRGYYTNSAQNNELPCARGTFSNEEGQTICYLCAEGKYTSSIASQHCNCTEPGYIPNEGKTDSMACPAGSFSSMACASECEACQSGRFQPSGHASECLCAVGGTIPFANKTGYEYCVAGKYAPGECNSECLACEDGKYSTSRGEEQCDLADYGYFVGPAGFRDRQEPCVPGTYGNEEGLTACKQCDSGQYSADYNMRNCLCAGIGQAASADRTTYINCGYGQYSDQNCSSACKTCQPGSYSAFEVNGGCDMCVQGHYQDKSGATECLECPIGTYIDGNGAMECVSCGISFYTMGTGQDKCLSCWSLEASIGFAHPDQCILIWILLAAIIVIVISSAFARCCRCKSHSGCKNANECKCKENSKLELPTAVPVGKMDVEMTICKIERCDSDSDASKDTAPPPPPPTRKKLSRV